MRSTVRRFVHSARIPVVLIIIFLISIFLVAQRVYLFQLGDRITALKEEIRSVRSQNDELEFQISQILETKRLEKAAYEDFALRSAKLDEIVVLSEPTMNCGASDGDAWAKVYKAARDTWDLLVARPLQLNKCDIAGSI